MIRRALSLALFFLLLCAVRTAAAQTKVDPFLELFPQPVSSKALSISLPAPSAAGPAQTEVFLKARDVAGAREAVRAAGGAVHAVVGDVLAASVPADGLQEVSASDAVLFVEAGKPIQTTNDVAGNEIGTPEVHAGLGLPAPLTGTGIVIGILDTGIDYTHGDFRDAQGRSRILAIWDQGRSGGKAPAEIENSYGVECDAGAIAAGSCPITDVDGHGTHVAGIAAGQDAKYGGVAPDANIIAVKYDASMDLETGYANPIFSTKICQAAYYVFTKAQALGLPAVVNLSLGTHLGAHDGSSLFEQCLAGLVKGAAGRALVAAAGNEHSDDQTYTGIHAGGTVNNQAVANNFVIRTATADRTYYIDLWGAKGSQFSAALAIHKGVPTSKPLDVTDLVPPGQQASDTLFGGQVQVLINATESASALNGKPHVGVRIIIDSSIAKIDDYSFDLIVSGTGSYDAWLFPDKPSRTIQFTSVSGSTGVPWSYVPGDRGKCIAIPATSPDIIAVAAYTTRNKWTVGSLSWTFNGQSLGDVLSFSSEGPTTDATATGAKPDLAAPGGMIASALSSQAAPSSQLVMDDGRHYLQAGTSMAAPFVAGTVALMFEVNPNFTHDDIKKMLLQSAYVDSFVGTAPNDRWGAGKLDVLAALQLASGAAPSGAFAANASVSPPADDAAPASSSCALVQLHGAGGDADLITFAAMMAPLLLLIIRRRSSSSEVLQ